MATMRPDPFYRRSGFWAALLATVPLGFAIARGTVSEELVGAVVLAWGAFFTAKQARPSNSNQSVLERMEAQQQLIRQLRTGSGGSGE